MCVAELVGLRDVAAEMNRKGGHLIAISVDRPEDSQKVVSKKSLPFHILADVDRKTITTYGLVHHGGSPKSEDIAIPAQMLIEKGGKIAWRHVARRVQDRPYPSDIMAEIARLH